MAMEKKIKKGDSVLVNIPEGLEGTDMIQKFNGQELEVSRVASVRNGYAELKGANSVWNIPYAFCTEWLVKC